MDYDKIQEKANEVKPQLIIAGASAYSRDIDFKRFREIADSVGAILLADISHPAGLIAKGILNDPIPHCHIVTTTTHKTLRGPRGGVIMLGKDFENPFGETTPKGKGENDEYFIKFCRFSWNTRRAIRAYYCCKSHSFWRGIGLMNFLITKSRLRKMLLPWPKHL